MDRRILIVDDQESNLRLLEYTLRRGGFTSLTSTTDPRAAAALHRDHHYDLILLDLVMPGLNGLEVADRCQNRLVLGRPGDDGCFFAKALRDAKQSEVDRLGARAEKRDLGAMRSQRDTGLVARAVEGGPRGAAFGVRARRVAVRKPADGVADLRQDGR